MPLMPRRRCRNSWQQAGRRHFGQLVADPYENEAVGETKLAATLARQDRKPQVTAGQCQYPMTVPDRARPLFTLDDIGVDNLRRWVDESQEWIRVVGPLVSTVYLSGAPVEVSVI